MASPAPTHFAPRIPSDRRSSTFPSTFGHTDPRSDNNSPSPHIPPHSHHFPHQQQHQHQHQQRAASQPPRATPESSLAYDQLRPRLEESVSPPRTSTSPIRKLSTSSAAWPPAIARPSPTAGSRSVSFSTFSEPQASSIHDNNNNANTNGGMSALMSHLNRETTRFPSTFDEDDESVDDDNYDYATPRRQNSNAGRSRPQSIGPGSSTSASERRSQQGVSGINTSFASSYGFTQGYGIPGPESSPIGTGYRPPSATIDDHTNMSPFLRDVSQILPDNRLGVYDSSRSGGSTLGGRSHHFGSAATYGHSSSHHMWTGNGGMGTAASSYSGVGAAGLGDDVHNGGGGGSGTQSRRHSVSVLQPRRISVGFNVQQRQEPPSPLSATSERPPSGFGSGSGRSGGAMFSDEELAGSLNMLSLNNLDGQDDLRSRRPPRVSGPSQPSSLPTYAPHHRSSLDALRLPQHMVSSNAGASSPTSSLGAPGDDIPGEYGGVGRRLASHSSSSARYSDSEASASPERRTQSIYANGHQQLTYQPQQGSGMSTLGNGYDPLAGIFGGSGIPSPTATFRATDALKQPSTYQSQFQDMFDNSASSSRPQLQRGRSASLHSTGVDAGYETNSNTPRGPISLSPQNSAHARQQPQPALPPLSFIGLGLPQQQQQQQQHLRASSSAMHSPTAGVNGTAYGYGPVSAGATYYGSTQPIGSSATLPGGNRQRQNSLPPQPPSSASSYVLSTPGISSGAMTGAGADIQLGRGVPLYAVPRDAPLFIVEFKAARNDIFYVTDPASFYADGTGELRVGELVIVEADRGRDLGRVTHGNISTADVEAWQRQQAEQAAIASLQGQDEVGGAGGKTNGIKELMPKKIYARATSEDIQQLQAKTADEAKALQLCQSKVRQKKLPMEVVDAEYQWDRRKLTFYFVADRRIDFRELVRELFRLYKTRIWMACLQGPPTSE